MIEVNSITFGSSILEYSIRLSPKAKKKRIEITPFSIEVVAPESATNREIEDFVNEKIKETFIAQEKLKAKNRSFFKEKDQFFSGGKVSFRGRRLAVTVEKDDVEEPVVIYKSRFNVLIPIDTPEDNKERVVEIVIKKWLRERLLQDSKELANELGKPHNLIFKSIRVREQKHIWATCGKDGVLHLNYLLIKVPRKILEYVIAHELAHLIYRNHSEAFWALVEKIIPDYNVYQDLLDGVYSYE